MDCQVNNNDKDDIWHPNFGLITKVPSTLGWECSMGLEDFRDGQIYNTVQIGEQCWMAENLNIGTQINIISEQTDNGVLEKYCYNNDVANCEVYGGLYQWQESMQYSSQQAVQGICPLGWHIPTDEEFIILCDYLGGNDIAGGK